MIEGAVRRSGVPLTPLELWGGIECTVNRVGDSFFDQLERSGHARRMQDLDLIAELGIRTLRYPLLWERVVPNGGLTFQWEWSDARMRRLRELAIEPVLGLLHHGSGPRATSLIDPDFPAAFARYAGAVAHRYPWVSQYIPINEPLTTARFSALYGHWYPHARDNRLFARAIVNQLRATALAMRAIRQVNPDAQLIQTEDLGKTYATPRLDYQAEFDNERRWLTFDVVCQRLDRSHAMWGFLQWAGIAQEELERLIDETCPAAVLGINHYLTSERFLDERVDRYPPCTQGGNDRDVYADIEAVRVVAEGVAGPAGILGEAWQRYHRPLALTEVHVGASREEQLRWLHEVWHSALEHRAAGTDVRAVTAWSIFGAYDWNSLLTQVSGKYESGVFDARDGAPRPTALARMIRELLRTGRSTHPVLAGAGWWRRESRLLFPAVRTAGENVLRDPDISPKGSIVGHPILITGAAGTLGRAFERVCRERGLAYRVCSRREMDIADPSLVERVLDECEPWAVVNAAGYVRVDDAEGDKDACYRENFAGPIALATACARRNIALLTFSSDLVFDGRRDRPYTEGDTTGPLSVYGRSKADAERRVLELLPTALVVRTSAFFGPWDGCNFVAAALHALDSGIPFAAPDDEMVSPTYVPDLVNAALDLLIDGESSIWHLANDGTVSWADLAREAAERAGLDTALLRPCRGASLARPALRPSFSALASERGRLLPPLADAMSRFFAARAASPQRT